MAKLLQVIVTESIFRFRSSKREPPRWESVPAEMQRQYQMQGLALVNSSNATLFFTFLIHSKYAKMI